MKRYCMFFVVFLMMFASVLPLSAGASVLETAGEFNTFIFGDYACTSDAEGRVAVGGNKMAVLQATLVAFILNVKRLLRVEAQGVIILPAMGYNLENAHSA